MKTAYSVTNTETHRNTEETAFVHAFTNHSNSKRLEKSDASLKTKEASN